MERESQLGRTGGSTPRNGISTPLIEPDLNKPQQGVFSRIRLGLGYLISRATTSDLEPSPTQQRIDTNDTRPGWTRRKFLKTAAAVVGGVVAHAIVPSHTAEARDGGVEAQRTAEDTWRPTLVTREWLLLPGNRQNIRAFTHVTNAEVEITRQLVIKRAGNVNRMYDTVYIPSLGVMDEYYPVSEVPIGYVQLVKALNENTVIAGGEERFQNGLTQLTISFDAGKTWQPIPWPYGAQGLAYDIVPLPGTNKFLFGTAHYHSSTRSMFVGNIDYENKRVTMNPTDISVFPRDLSILSFDPKSNTGSFVATGTEASRAGFLQYDIDFNTMKGAVTPFLEHLGELIGKGEYTDDNGDMHVITSTFFKTPQKLYDINLKTKTVVQEVPYSNLLDNKNIPGYEKGSLTINAVEILKMPNGDRKVIFAGFRSTTTDSYPRAIVGSFILGKTNETLVYNDLMPNQHSGIGFQQNIKLVKTRDGKSVLVAKLYSPAYPLGLIAYDHETNKVLYTDNGLQRTTETRPQSRPNYYRIGLPTISRNYRGVSAVSQEEAEKESLVA